MNDLKITLEEIEHRYQAANDAAGAAYERYQQTGHALTLEKQERRSSWGERYETQASRDHELAGEALSAANVELTRLGQLRDRLRQAIRQA